MKKNFLLITGGTGGHVIPAKNFANYLSIQNVNCTIITDKRGYKYFNNYFYNSFYYNKKLIKSSTT